MFLYRAFILWMVLFAATQVFAFAQGVTYNLDTARAPGAGCDTLPVLAYFQVKGKYPESSQTLTRWADSTLWHSFRPGDINGYITFRFMIDCHGQLTGVRLFQTNEKYEAGFFPKEIVERLYTFVRSLDGWKRGMARSRQVNYSAYLSFRIEHGHVVQTSP